MSHKTVPIGIGIVVLSLIVSVVAPAAVAAPVAETSGDRAALSGSTAADGGPTALDAQNNSTDSAEAGADDTPADPANDTLGWENGYWYNESIDVDQSDGLTEAELDAYVARSMARVEEIRRLEFTGDVPVEVITREQYLDRSGNLTGGTSAPSSAWNNQVWEALFTVNESTNVTSELAALYGGSVLGYYSPSEDRIVVVSDNPEQVVLDNATLTHELVHALQDQQFDLTRSRYGGETQDGSLAASGIVEGDANYVEARYTQNCGVNYTCVDTPTANGSGGLGPVNLGIYTVIIQPYSDGQAFVADLREEGGWAAVNEAYAEVPNSTEQTIHPDRYPNETPADVAFTDTAEDGWETFAAYNGTGADGSDTVGEVSTFEMLWYQGYRYGTPVANTSSFLQPDAPPYDFYNYSSPASNGWGGDRLTPYYKPAGDAEEADFDDETAYGYVWRTEWDGEENATEFERAYLATLGVHNATKVADGTYVIPEGEGDGYADAFYVCRNGDSVVIVNAPTIEGLHEIKPDFDIPEDASMPEDGESEGEDGNGTGTGGEDGSANASA